jgi:hypothetical protein
MPTNYAGVSDSNNTPQNAVYDTGSGTVLPPQAGTVTTDTSHGSQKTAPMLVQLAAGSAAAGHVILDANSIATYAASITNLVPAASCTDLFTLTGGTGKVIRITRISVSATTTSATPATNDVVLLVRSTANSAGTATQPAVVPYDSADAAAVGVVNAYTANPTTGTLVGNIYAAKLSPTLATATATDFPSQVPVVVQFGVTDSKPVVLRGATQVFAVNLAGASATGTASWDLSIEWSEASV